jgi:hypothetical protein
MGASILGQEFATWEGGSSIPIGAKASQLKKQHPFTPAYSSNYQGPTPEAKVYAAYNALLARPAMQGDIICTDLLREGRPLHERLLLASRRPKEIIDDVAHAALTNLMHAEVHTVHLASGDITSQKQMRAVRDDFSHAHKRLGVLGTVLNQVGQSEVEPTVRNAMELLDDNGILLILEFASVDAAGKIHLSPEWREYTYQMLALHKQHPGRVDELMRFRSSRMEEPEFNPAGMLDWGDGRGLVPFTDQLLYAANKS